MELSNEAKILFDAGAVKRASFLALTSYEEAMKIVLLVKNRSHRGIFNHGKKFRDFQIIIKEIIRKEFAAEFKRFAESRNNTITPEEVEKNFLKSFIGPHDLEKMRTALLYSHLPKKRIEMAIINNEEELGRFFQGMQIMTGEIIEFYLQSIERMRGDGIKVD